MGRGGVRKQAKAMNATRMNEKGTVLRRFLARCDIETKRNKEQKEHNWPTVVSGRLVTTVLTCDHIRVDALRFPPSFRPDK